MPAGDDKVARYVSPGTGPESGLQAHDYEDTGRTDSTGLAVLAPRVGSAFARLLKFEPAAGQELRASETTTDRFHGAAPDGTATSAAEWEVVRFYKDAGGAIVRVRHRTGVVWDDHESGW